MLTLAHRRAVDRVRSSTATHSSDHLWAVKQSTGIHDSAVESAHSSIEAARVRCALDNLGVKQRAVVQLAYVGGLTHTDVATRLDIRLGTAKSRIREGLRGLADAVERPIPTSSATQACR